MFVVVAELPGYISPSTKKLQMPKLDFYKPFTSQAIQARSDVVGADKSYGDAMLEFE